MDDKRIRHGDLPRGAMSPRSWFNSPHKKNQMLSILIDAHRKYSSKGHIGPFSVAFRGASALHFLHWSGHLRSPSVTGHGRECSLYEGELIRGVRGLNVVTQLSAIGPATTSGDAPCLRDHLFVLFVAFRSLMIALIVPSAAAAL